jgi:hypothetical protein
VLVAAIVTSYNRKRSFAVQTQSAMQPQLRRKVRPEMNKGAPTGDLRPIEEILDDRAASFWLKAALRSALLRDPVDAANDAEVLARLLERRCRSTLDNDTPI